MNAMKSLGAICFVVLLTIMTPLSKTIFAKCNFQQQSTYYIQDPHPLTLTSKILAMAKFSPKLLTDNFIRALVSSTAGAEVRACFQLLKLSKQDLKSLRANEFEIQRKLPEFRKLIIKAGNESTMIFREYPRNPVLLGKYDFDQQAFPFEQNKDAVPFYSTNRGGKFAGMYILNKRYNPELKITKIRMPADQAEVIAKLLEDKAEPSTKRNGRYIWYEGIIEIIGVEFEDLPKEDAIGKVNFQYKVKKVNFYAKKETCGYNVGLDGKMIKGDNQNISKAWISDNIFTDHFFSLSEEQLVPEFKVDRLYRGKSKKKS